MRTLAREAERRGLSLVELLIALTIIGVIAALLFTTLRIARENRHAATCLSNIRELAAASLLYAADNGGQFCLAMDKANKRRWHGERKTLELGFDPKAGPLSPYLGKDGTVKICPALEHYLTGRSSFEDGAGGYGYNALYIGGTPANRWEGERICNIVRPSQTVMFTDSAMAKRAGVQEYPFSEPWDAVTPKGDPAGPLTPSVHFRHRGVAHVAWCDGHVSTEKPSAWGTTNFYGGNNKKHNIGWFGPSDQNGYWNPQREEQHAGEPRPRE